jgi:HSP20 family molecular chaperone IbpA
VAQKSSNDKYSTREVVAGIGTYGAAAMLCVSAIVTILQGISALAHDRTIVDGPGYAYQFNTTAWGWIHIVVGILVGAVAFGLFWSTTWARVAAIIIASLSIVSQFLWLPHYPIWAIVVIALDIFVIWAVATWESPAARASSQAKGAPSVLGAQPGSRWPEVSQWLGGFPSWSMLQPMFGGQPIRLEDGINDGRYEIRAELPGVDPAKDVDVTTRDGVLTIRAQRSEKDESKGRSEFSYGSFVRSVTLPPGSNENDISVTYRDGILTVSVGLQPGAPGEKRSHVSSET